jgi:hypothetical protein
MQFLRGVMETVSAVSNLFSNPYRVREVPLSEYSGGGKVKLKEEGRMVLYKNTPCQSWDCLLKCPDTPTVALRWVGGQRDWDGRGQEESVMEDGGGESWLEPLFVYAHSTSLPTFFKP